MTGAMVASGALRLLLAEVATARTLLDQLAAEIESVRLPAIDLDLRTFVAFIEATVEQLERAT